VKKKALLLILLTIFISLGAQTTSTDDDTTQAAEKTAAKPRVGRALFQLGVTLAVSTRNYWRKYTKFIEDWQFELNWKDQRRKIFTSEGLRLDSNLFSLNWTHAWAGGLYYNWGRTNRFNVFSSFLFSAGSSLYWEYIAEWREISSINDHVFTALGGLAIGEPLYQIGNHFRSRPGLLNRIATLLVNPNMGINDVWDGKSRSARVPTSDWNDFRFLLGYKNGPVSPATGDSSHASLDLDLRLVTLPGYGAPGRASGYARQPIDNGYRWTFSFNRHGLEEMSGSTRTVLGGWWRRHLRQDGSGGLRGSECWLGPAMGWELFQKKAIVPYDGDDLGKTDPWQERERPTRFSDKHSLIHLIGPAGHWAGYANRLSARVDLGAFLDFGMVNSLAYNDYTSLHDPWGVKTTLHNWGYYYSLGYTLAGRCDVRRGPWGVEANITYQRFRSIEGHDRFQSSILDDAPLRDSRLSYHAGLSFALPRSPFFLQFNLQGIDRWGRFHEVNVSHRETRFYYQVGVRF